MKSRSQCLLAAWALVQGGTAWAAGGTHNDPFAQLEQQLPTPTQTRIASGAPGQGYWQQWADYDIEVELDDLHQRIIGSERIRYHNRSPHDLDYLWVQLDANYFRPDAPGARSQRLPFNFDRVSYRNFAETLASQSFDGGVKLSKVASGGRRLEHTVVGTMMRIDLPEPLKAGRIIDLDIDWSYYINNSKIIGGRTGFERLEDGHYLYEIAQWFPRMAAYDDVNGWQNKQFMGRGEFALEFGDYEVAITVPEDHIVAATGELQNPRSVLSATQRRRLRDAESSSKPVFIVTPKEAQKTAKRKGPAKGKKTWKFKAKNVRDFAFASSKRFIWDAKLQKVGKNKVWAMSYYPQEGEPLWSRYSTKAIMHTLDVYSRYTFEYPYPVAISVNGPVGGMEYPMICFNGPRPEKDGTYTARTKHGLISVIIHEVGHNFFPMIVNSDERQWTWMDEGLNTFVQFLAEQEWSKDYPSRRGEPAKIVPYMSSEHQVPIMTNSESILQFGNNAYGKPATALNILRETILGRELFDQAFKHYAQRWQFKRPMPADFFRTIEDASGVDLDWFWRGWFYTTDHTDIAITKVTEFRVNTKNPDQEKAWLREQDARKPESITKRRNRGLRTLEDQDESLKDFYSRYDPFRVTDKDRSDYAALLKNLSVEERALLQDKHFFYGVEFENLGGLVMPILLEIHYVDGRREMRTIPAEIWRQDPKKVAKLVVTKHRVDRFVVDPHQETADTDRSNNYFPPRIQRSRFEVYEKKKEHPNPMREQLPKKKKGGKKKRGKKAKKGKEGVS